MDLLEEKISSTVSKIDFFLSSIVGCLGADFPSINHFTFVMVIDIQTA